MPTNRDIRRLKRARRILGSVFTKMLGFPNTEEARVKFLDDNKDRLRKAAMLLLPTGVATPPRLVIFPSYDEDNRVSGFSCSW